MVSIGVKEGLGVSGQGKIETTLEPLRGLVSSNRHSSIGYHLC